MTEHNVRIELPLILPDAPHARDACVHRLVRDLLERKGILDVHVSQDNTDQALLCVHYDAGYISADEAETLAARSGAGITARYGHLSMPLHAVAAEDSARRIESALLGVEGVIEAAVSLPAQRAHVEFEHQRIDEARIRRELESLGYGVLPKPPAQEQEKRASVVRWVRRNAELTMSLGAGLLLVVAWAGERWLGLPARAAVGAYVASYFLGGWDLVTHWVRAVRKGGRLTFDIDLLMLVAALGAALLGEWIEGAFLLFLFSLAHALEHLALDRARGAIRALADLAPPMAIVRRDGWDVEVPVELVNLGDLVVVRPAERIPVDGRVRKGRSAVNQAPITGESVPVEKDTGDEVYAGTVNGDGSLEIETTRAAGDRTLDRVIQLVEEAQTRKAPTERFTDRFATVFVPIVLVSATALAVLPPVIGFWDWGTAFYRAMALLVAASPCALAIGTPSAVLAGIAQAARNGVLVKGGVHLEALGGISALALDKTGTLTLGRPEVAEIRPAAGVADRELLAIAAAVERNSQHPLAEAVVRRADADGIAVMASGELQSVTARGVRSTVDGQSVDIGNARLWTDEGVTVPDEIRTEMDRLAASGMSVMAVRHGERWLGSVGIADLPRPGVREILERIRAHGVRTLIMITGDNEGVARAVARDVGIDDVRADLLPEDKVDAVRELLAEHHGVAMVGDGVNDAPALATATVGIAMGGAGTAAALETADVALMGDALEGIPFAIGLARRTRNVIRQNLVVSMCVIAILILATTTGVLGIGPAVLIHEGSTLAVIANALRLLRYEE